MTVTAELIRELAARGESAQLDFKEKDYDWTQKAASNAELAKDLMAMANLLGASSPPAYILIGVRDDGDIVGVVTAHLNDAVLQQKVRDLLIRVPNFTYHSVDVDGVSVGVYEIKPGGRPFFALKASPPLQKNISFYRAGSSTEVASPTMIIDWYRADNAEEHELRSIELKRARVDAQVRGRIYATAMSYRDPIEHTLVFENTGNSGFSVRSATYEMVMTKRFAEHVASQRVHLANNFVGAFGELSIVGEHVGAGQQREFQFRFTRVQGAQHLSKYGVGGWDPGWCRFQYKVQCESDLGPEGTIQGFDRQE